MPESNRTNPMLQAQSGPIMAHYGTSERIYLEDIFLTMLAQSSHICGTFATRNWSISQMTGRVLWNLSVTRTSVIKTHKCESHSLSRNCDKWQCITIVILMFTGRCHNANFIVTVGTASYNDNLLYPRWWQSWRHDDSRLSVQWHTNVAW